MKTIAWFIALACCGVVYSATDKGDAPSLTYKFKGLDRVYYKVTEKIDDGTGVSVTVAYVGFSPKRYRKELELAYGASMGTQPMTAGGAMPDIPPNANLFDGTFGSKVTIDASGKVVSNASHQDTNLPGAIAQSWQIPLPELPSNGANSWQSSRKINVVVHSTGHFGMPMMMGVRPSPATINNNYTLHGDPQDGAQTIDFTTDFTTDGSQNFGEHASGSGSLVFDMRLGLLRTLDEKMDATVTLQGKDQKATITVGAELLEKEDVDRLIASAAEEKKRWKAVEEEVAAKRGNSSESQNQSLASGDSRPRLIRQMPKETHWMQSLDLPEGTEHTDFVGNSEGGLPFLKTGNGQRPMIGVKCILGSFGHPCIRQVEPIYDQPMDPASNKKDQITILAKPGYVVGGMWANGPDYTDALRVIFMKATDTGVSVKDQYNSPWIGTPQGSDRIKLGCTGQIAVGVFGRQGLNADAFGLVMRSGGTAARTDPTDDPNYQGTNVKPNPSDQPAKH